MVLTLVIGDSFIPTRAIDLPEKFRNLLVPGKISHIISTGNLINKSTFDYLNSLAGEVVIVRGDQEQSILPSEERQFIDKCTLMIGQLKFGVIHGHQIIPWGDAEALSALARQWDVDVLVSGHTHHFEAYEYNERFFLNPGSATGAFLPGASERIPSFALLDVQGRTATIYGYHSVHDEVKVEKMNFQKQ